MPLISPTARVEPEREIPGKIAATNCIRPTHTASRTLKLSLPAEFSLCFTFFKCLKPAFEPIVLLLQIIPTVSKILVIIKEIETTIKYLSPVRTSARSLIFISVPGIGRNNRKSGRSPIMSIIIRFLS